MWVGGHPGGVGSETLGGAMSLSRDHCIGLTIRLEGRIGSGFLKDHLEYGVLREHPS